MNQPSINIYKKRGETPLEALDRFRAENPGYNDEKMTYAGRLDPLAEGELLVLVGEECKKKEEYLKKDKEYVFEVLCGFATDSYDLLGLVSGAPSVLSLSEVVEVVKKDLPKFIGKRMQEYPPFSSKTVGGVPLFQKTRDGDETPLPHREVEIYSLEFENAREIRGEELLAWIQSGVESVNGDFRQGEIMQGWRSALRGKEMALFPVIQIRMNCSSGTYVRALVHELPFPATTFSITRTRIY